MWPFTKKKEKLADDAEPYVRVQIDSNGRPFVRCPWCGKDHHHHGLGPRNPHCHGGGLRQYFLIGPDDPMPEDR